MDLLIVVQAGAKICAAARRYFGVAPESDFLGGAEGHTADANITPEFGLIGTHQSLGRKDRVVGAAPYITITAAQGKFRRRVEDNIDLFLTVVRYKGRSELGGDLLRRARGSECLGGRR